MGIQRGSLGEKSLRSQRSVHLVGGDLLELHPVPVAVLSRLPCMLGKVQQVQRTHDVRPDEHVGVGDGAVHMALSRKVHYIVNLILLEQLMHGNCIADVCLHEHMPLVSHDRLQVLKVSCIGKLVHVDY
ncbi:hypothetical protein SDC9_79477 [bioreactor metagenome]|uniref:Uncharacterized protein n=1 Tax=bioreactor metagenome TaxID=1076179 RepID=A0A644YWB6_9ZZZZ